MARNRLFLALCFTVAISCSGQDTTQSWDQEFVGSLKSLSTDLVYTSWDTLHEAGLLSVADFPNAKSSVPALFGLWLQGKSVEVHWWRHWSRTPRAFLAALYLCRSSGPPYTSAMPSLKDHTDRFAEPEKSERKAELEFIESNRAELASLLAKAYEAWGAQSARAYRSYKAVASAGKRKKAAQQRTK